MKLLLGDCLDRLKDLPDNSVDSIVTDPPYGLSFMGKKWDYDVPSEDVWRECLRVLKPGGHLLAFAGTRTQHRMAIRIEDAGFEIRDMIAWVYGSGFPKSLNIGKAVDKLQGHEREIVGEIRAGATAMGQNSGWNAHENKTVMPLTKGTSPWEGWGTALKPALEPITVARKPLIGTVAENVLKYGTGGINIDGCRVGNEVRFNAPAGNSGNEAVPIIKSNDNYQGQEVTGRFPANLIHDGSEEVVGLFPQQKSPAPYSRKTSTEIEADFLPRTRGDGSNNYGDSGSAARFFYQASGEKHDIMSTCKNTNARTVLNFLQTIPLTIGSIVAKSATLTPNESLAQNVRSAGIACDSCAIAIAQSLAAMMTENMASQVIQACTTSYAGSTPHQNLAEIVEQWANTDTIPTTASLLKLFGSVLLAIDANTNLDNKGKEVADNGQEKETVSRIIYQAKASKKDREEGLDGFEAKNNMRVNGPRESEEDKHATKRANHHPTVKPTDLMRYLCRLVTPPGGTVLDPFTGSGSTGKAALMEGFDFIGIERDYEYYKIALARCHAVKPTLFAA